MKSLIKILVILLLSGCHSVNNDQKMLIEKNIPNLSQINDAKSIVIEDDWIGYSDITPIQRHYRLNIREKTVDGNIYTAVGGYGYGDIRQQKTKNIQLSRPIINDFLNTLSKTSLIMNKTPIHRKKDNFPQINIKIKLDHDEVIISSTSAHDDHVPWYIYWRSTNKKYMTTSSVPFRALNKLRPYIEDQKIAQHIQNKQQKLKW